MSNVGFATVSIVPSAKGFQAALNKEMGPGLAAAGTTAGTKSGDKFRNGFLSKVKGIAGPLVAAMGVGAIGGFLKGAIDQASGLQEAGTALKTVFGDGYDEINKFGSQGAAALGQSRLDALKAAQSFGVYGKAAGLSGTENAKFSSSLVGLGTDLASFYDASPEEAIAAIGSGLRGEAEPLRRFGVLLDDATLKAQAMKMGLISNTKDALTPQNKVLAAQAVIMNQSKVAQGDFAKTSGGLANQQRILGASFADLKGKVGEQFLPVAAKVTKWAADFVTGMQNSTGAGGAFADKIKTVASAVQAFVTDFKNSEGAAGTLRTALETLGTAFTTLLTAGRAVVTFMTEHKTTTIAAGVAIGALMAVTKLHATVMTVQAAGGLLAMLKGTTLVTTVTKTYTAVQWLLNAALTANPIGLVIAAIALLAAGLIIAYKQSETFRDFVGNAFDNVKIAAIQLAIVAVGAFQSMAGMFLEVVSTLVSGAAKAFGWVPGLGPKLKTAAANMEGFKRNANASLDGVKKKLEIDLKTAKAQEAINDLRRMAGKPVSMTVFMKTRYTQGHVNVEGLGKVNVGMRANGGPVTKGTPYVVGERRPELFVPESNGRIVPRVPGADTSAPAPSGGPVHVTASIQIGKREFASMVAEANTYNDVKGGTR